MKYVFNKKLLFACAYCVSHSVFSGTMGPEINENFNPKNGLYIGAGVGTFFNDYTLHTVDIPTGFNATTRQNNANVIGNLFLGLGCTAVNSLYLGGEIGTNFPGRSANIYNTPSVSIGGGNIFSNTLNVQDYITIDVLPGYRLTGNWLAYARIGAAFADFHFSQDANPVANTVVINKRSTQFGGRFGVGSTYAFNKYLSLSADYFYAEYTTYAAFIPEWNIDFKNNGKYNYVGLSLTYTT